MTEIEQKREIRIVVVEFAPAVDSPNAVGGFNWRPDTYPGRREAVAELTSFLYADGGGETYDLLWRRVDVPRAVTDGLDGASLRNAITEWYGAECAAL